MRRAVLAVLVLVAALTAAKAQWRDDYPVIRIGVVAGASPTNTRDAVEPFRIYLEEWLGVRVEIYATADYPALISGQLTGRFELAFLTATGFVTIAAACGECVEPFVAPVTDDGAEGFHAVLVVAAGSPIAGPEDLPGMRLAVSQSDSVAGRVLPLALFAADEIDVEAIDLIERESPEDAVLALLAGEADAALAWSSLAGSASEGYSRGVLRRLVEAGALTMNAVEIAWRSPLIPNGPMTGLAILPEEMKAAIVEAMTAVEGDAAVALAAVNGLGGGRFVEIGAEAYAPLQLLLPAN